MLALVPSPKSHDQLVTSPVVVFVKFTVRGASPDVTSAVNAATGGGGRTVAVI